MKKIICRKIICFLLLITLVVSHSHALIDFLDQEQAEKIGMELEEKYHTKNIEELNRRWCKLQVLQRSLMRGNHHLQLCGQKLTDEDLPLLYILLQYNQDITYIDLSENQLTKFNYFTASSCDSELHRVLPNLTTLLLSNNQLTKFNGNDMLVHRLDLSNNKLSEFKWNKLPNVAQLNLSNNQLSKIDYDQLSNVHLTVLNLSQNKLTAFSDHHFPILTKLFLFQNQLTSFCYNSLPCVKNVLIYSNHLLECSNNNLPKLKSRFDLSKNHDLRSFRGNHLDTLRILDLYDNNRLYNFYQNSLGNLEVLSLADQKITFDHIKEVVDVAGINLMLSGKRVIQSKLSGTSSSRTNGNRLSFVWTFSFSWEEDPEEIHQKRERVVNLDDFNDGNEKVITISLK